MGDAAVRRNVRPTVGGGQLRSKAVYGDGKKVRAHPLWILRALGRPQKAVNHGLCVSVVPHDIPRNVDSSGFSLGGAGWGRIGVCRNGILWISGGDAQWQTQGGHCLRAINLSIVNIGKISYRLAVTGCGGGVCILLGHGDGTFSGPCAVSTGAVAGGACSDIVLGDFNGDGKPDIGFLNLGQGTAVGTILGNGDGTSQPATTYGDAQYPSAIAVADFNGDHHQDLTGKGGPDLVSSAPWGLAVMLNSRDK
jgi:hypothetical protein